MDRNCFWSFRGFNAWILLFNIFLADLFFIVDDVEIACYRDNNTPYVSGKYIEEVIKTLEEASKVLFKWFADNLFKSIGDKCYLLVNVNVKINIRIDNIDICNSKFEKLSGVKFDNKLTFDDRISELSKETSQKVQVLPRVTSYINTSKESILMNTFLHQKLVIGLSLDLFQLY